MLLFSSMYMQTSVEIFTFGRESAADQSYLFSSCFMSFAMTDGACALELILQGKA